jgi:hypothetical protein
MNGNGAMSESDVDSGVRGAEWAPGNTSSGESRDMPPSPSMWKSVGDTAGPLSRVLDSVGVATWRDASSG